jgi:hypothetical protein
MYGRTVPILNGGRAGPVFLGDTPCVQRVFVGHDGIDRIGDVCECAVPEPGPGPLVAHPVVAAPDHGVVVGR